MEQYLSRHRLLRLRYERELGTTYGDRHHPLLLPSKSRQPDKLGPVAYREHAEASNVVDTSTGTWANREEAVRLVGPHVKSKDLFDTRWRCGHVVWLGLSLNVVEVHEVSAMNGCATLVRPVEYTNQHTMYLYMHSA